MPESDSGPPENRGKNRGLLPPVETRWKKGQSGNPGGRPKTKPLTDAYRSNLSEIVTARLAKRLKLPSEFVGLTIAQVIAIGQATAAIKGNTGAAREIADRVEGPLDPKNGDGPRLGGMIVVIHALDRDELLRRRDEARRKVLDAKVVAAK